MWREVVVSNNGEGDVSIIGYIEEYSIKMEYRLCCGDLYLNFVK